MEQPDVTYLQDTYRFLWKQAAVDLVLDALGTNRSGELAGEMTITSSRPAQGGHIIGPVKFNVVGATSIRTMVAALRDRLDDREEDDLDWTAMLEQVRKLTVERWREGEPIVRLSDVAPAGNARFLLPPFIEEHGATVIFADGGSGKSVVALAMAVTVATGIPILGRQPAYTCPVLYLDWETDETIHAERMRAICAGYREPFNAADVPVYYRKQFAALSDSAQVLRRKVAELGIGLVIVDSIGLAGNGPPEEAETKRRLFTAARSLDVPTLGIDHIAKAQGTDKSKPYGSVYTHNSARLTWSLESAQSEDYGETVSTTVMLRNHKANNGRRARPVGFTVTFRNTPDDRLESVSFEECEVRDIPAFAGKVSHKDLIVAILKANQGVAMQVGDLVQTMAIDGVDVTDDIVRVTLNRHKDVFTKIGSAWGLLTRAEYAHA